VSGAAGRAHASHHQAAAKNTCCFTHGIIANTPIDAKAVNAVKQLALLWQQTPHLATPNAELKSPPEGI